MSLPSSLMPFLNSKVINIVIILLIFTLTGFTAAFVSGYIMEALHLKIWSAGYIIGIIFIITPVYQVLLLIYAGIFGKFRYFLDKQLKILSIIRKAFRSGNHDR